MENIMGNIIKTAILASGALASFLFGEFTPLLKLLVIAVSVDYATGVLSAFIIGKRGGQGLNSRIGLEGIARKVFIFSIVAVAHMADQATGTNMLMTAAIFYYLANEFLSILENAGKIGLPVPEFLAKAIDVLKKKGDGK